MSSGERPYYVILGITKSATPAEIRRAYRQKALLYHPDKVGPEGTERFQFLQQAYAVLSDPQKKAVYDQFGERGLDMPGADQLGQVLGSSIAGTFLALGLMLMVALLIIFLAFLCVRVDHTVMWDWTSVWIPLYILMGILAIPLLLQLLCLPCRACQPTPADETDEDGEPITKPPVGVEIIVTFCRNANALLWMIFFVTISAGLQRDMNGTSTNWWHYFIPVFMAEGLSFIDCVVLACVKRLNVGGITREFAGVPKCLLGLWTVAEILCICARVCQWALIAAKVMGDIDVSWWVVFIPAYILFFLSVVSAAVSNVVQSFAQMAAAGVDEASRGSMGPLICYAACQAAVLTTIAIGVVYASVFMIIARLDGKDIRLDYALIPIFCILVLFFNLFCCGFCYCCCTVCGVTAEMNKMGEGGADAESGDAPPPEGPSAGEGGQQRATAEDAAMANGTSGEDGGYGGTDGGAATTATDEYGHQLLIDDGGAAADGNTNQNVLPHQQQSTPAEEANSVAALD